MSPSRAWLIDLGLAANVALGTIALPVYVRLYASPGLEALVRLVAGTYLIPALALFAAARALARWPRAHGAYWGVAIALTALSILRAWDTHVAGLLDNIEPTRLSLFDTTISVAIPLLFLSGAVAGATRFSAIGPSVASLAPIWILATVVFIAPLALAPEPRSHTPEEAVPGPVYVFILDGLGREAILRNGQVDAELFPSFHALASDGLLFTDATTNWGFTCHSLPTILGGVSLAPCGGGFLADTARPTLLSALAARYRVVVYEEWLRTCESGAPYECRDPAYLAAAYPGRVLLAHWIPRNVRIRALTPLGSELVGGPLTPYTLTLYDELLRDLDHPDAASTASFVHVLVPHDPFIFAADGSLHGEPASFVRLPEDDAGAHARYIEQVRFTDLLLGRFLMALRERGLYENATIVVTGDHGPAPPLDWDGSPSQLFPYVTLIMRGPGISIGTTDLDYQHIDLTPSMTDRLGLEPVPGSIGVSVFAADRPEREKTYGWRGERYRFDPGLGRWVRE